MRRIELHITNGWRLRSLRELRRTRRGRLEAGEVWEDSKVIARWRFWNGGSPTSDR